MRNVFGMFCNYLYGRNWKKMCVVHILDLFLAASKALAPFFVINLIDDYVAKKVSEDDVLGVVPARSDVLLDVGMFDGALLLGSVGLIASSIFLPRLRNIIVGRVRYSSEKDITFDIVRTVYYKRELDSLWGSPTGSCAVLASKNYGSVGLVVPSFFSGILPTISETIGISSVLFYCYEGVGLTPIVTLATYLLAALFRERASTRIKEKNSMLMREAFGALLHAVDSYQIAHQFGNTEYELKILEKEFSRMADSFNEVHAEGEKNSLVLSTINLSGSIAMLAYYVFFRYSNNSTFLLKDLILFIYCTFRLNSILSYLPVEIGNFYQGLLDTKLLVDFFDERPKIAEPKMPLIFKLTKAPRIEFKSVSFAYIAGKQNLRDISFVLEPGKRVAIMGSTGSGKTTILKLIQRFYDYQGQILINGMDIKLLSTKDLRGGLSVVSQETGITGKTVFKSIRYGDLQAEEREVFAAAERAGLSFERHRFFSSIQQQGADFSGGERQRISIARSLLKKEAYIFLLDEPTSALDQETSRRILESLDRETRNATTLIVTHDPNVAINADYIVYLDQGTIIERGNFEELLRLKGAFYRQILVQCEKLGIKIEDIRPINRQVKYRSSSPLSFFDGAAPSAAATVVATSSSRDETMAFSAASATSRS